MSAYFFGEAIPEVFEKASDIVLYNTRLDGSKAGTGAEAERLGGLFVLPKAVLLPGPV